VTTAVVSVFVDVMIFVEVTVNVVVPPSEVVTVVVVNVDTEEMIAVEVTTMVVVLPSGTHLHKSSIPEDYQSLVGLVGSRI
jgi:hypothetical protein